MTVNSPIFHTVHIKKIRGNTLQCNLESNMLISRNFCGKCLRVNFRNLHNVVINSFNKQLDCRKHLSVIIAFNERRRRRVLEVVAQKWRRRQGKSSGFLWKGYRSSLLFLVIEWALSFKNARGSYLGLASCVHPSNEAWGKISSKQLQNIEEEPF